MKRDEKLLFILLALSGVGAWLWLSQSGRTLSQSAGLQLESGVLRVADLSNSTLQTIIGFESFSATPYPDAKGWSIGYGHFMGPAPTMQSISRTDAYNLLRDDSASAADYVKQTLTQPANQNEFDAMVSLAYNIGGPRFQTSTVARMFNAGDKLAAADAFRLWNKSQGRVNAGLVDRRETERALFLS